MEGPCKRPAHQPPFVVGAADDHGRLQARTCPCCQRAPSQAWPFPLQQPQPAIAWRSISSAPRSAGRGQPGGRAARPAPWSRRQAGPPRPAARSRPAPRVAYASGTPTSRASKTARSPAPSAGSDTISTHLVHPPGVAALRALGPARPARGHRLPADRHLRVRLRPVHDRGRAGHAPTRRSRTARGAPCSTSCWSMPRPRPAPRSARVSGSRTIVVEDGRVAGIRGHGRAARTSPSAPGSSSAPTARTRCVARGCRPGAVPREAAAAVRLLQLLERAADGRPLRDLRPRPAAASRRGRPTTT